MARRSIGPRIAAVAAVAIAIAAPTVAEAVANLHAHHPASQRTGIKPPARP